VINLSMLSKSRVIVTLWLVAFGVFAVFQLPVAIATAALLFVVGVVPLLVLLVLSNRPSPTIAEVLYCAEAPRTDRGA